MNNNPLPPATNATIDAAASRLQRRRKLAKEIAKEDLKRRRLEALAKPSTTTPVASFIQPYNTKNNPLLPPQTAAFLDSFIHRRQPPIKPTGTPLDTVIQPQQPTKLKPTTTMVIDVAAVDAATVRLQRRRKLAKKIGRENLKRRRQEALAKKNPILPPQNPTTHDAFIQPSRALAKKNPLLPPQKPNTTTTTTTLLDTFIQPQPATCSGNTNNKPATPPLHSFSQLSREKQKQTLDNMTATLDAFIQRKPPTCLDKMKPSATPPLQSFIPPNKKKIPLPPPPTNALHNMTATAAFEDHPSTLKQYKTLLKKNPLPPNPLKCLGLVLNKDEDEEVDARKLEVLKGSTNHQVSSKTLLPPDLYALFQKPKNHQEEVALLQCLLKMQFEVDKGKSSNKKLEKMMISNMISMVINKTR